MKKLLCILCVFSLLLTLCAGALADDVIELEYLNHKPEASAIDAMQAIIDAFNASHPGIHVTQTTTPDFNTVLTTRAQTNDLPDLFSCSTSSSWELLYKDGMIMNIDGQAFLENVEAETLSLSQLDGETWRMPYSLSCYGLYVRTDIFEKLGLALPETWEDLLACCETLKANGYTPFIMGDKDMGTVGQRMERLMGIINPDCNEEFAAIYDGELDPADSVVLSVFPQAFIDIANYSAEDSLGVDNEAAYQNFVAGQGALMIQGTWALATLQAYDPELQVAFIPLPNPTGDVDKVPISIDTSFCISANTKYPEACLTFMEYMSTIEAAQVYCDGEGSPNVIKGVVYGVKEFEKITAAMNEGRVFVSLNAVWPSGFRNALRDYAQALIMDKDAEPFVEAALEVIGEYYAK